MIKKIINTTTYVITREDFIKAFKLPSDVVIKWVSCNESNTDFDSADILLTATSRRAWRGIIMVKGDKVKVKNLKHLREDNELENLSQIDPKE